MNILDGAADGAQDGAAAPTAKAENAKIKTFEGRVAKFANAIDPRFAGDADKMAALIDMMSDRFFDFDENPEEDRELYAEVAYAVTGEFLFSDKKLADAETEEEAAEQLYEWVRTAEENRGTGDWGETVRENDEPVKWFYTNFADRDWHLEHFREKYDGSDFSPESDEEETEGAGTER